jgi:hypothetical protein
MITYPFTIPGDAFAAPPVLNCHMTRPVRISRALSIPSSDPAQTMVLSITGDAFACPNKRRDHLSFPFFGFTQNTRELRDAKITASLVTAALA